MCCSVSFSPLLTARTLVLHLIISFTERCGENCPSFSGAFHIHFQVWVHNVALDSLVYPIEQICDSSGEDPTCSRSLLLYILAFLPFCELFASCCFFHANIALLSRSVSGNSVQDHLNYLGISMQSESRGSCRIVTDGNMLRYKIGALDGAIIFSKQPGSPVDQQLSAL